MQTTLLMIVHMGAHVASTHDTVANAWAALMAFVTAHWSENAEGAPMPANEEERAQLFFRGENDNYVIAQIDIAGIVDALSEAGGDPADDCRLAPRSPPPG